MKRGPKPRPVALKIVDGTYRPNRADRPNATDMIDGDLIPLGEAPKAIRGRAREIWDELLADQPFWTRQQKALMPVFVRLKAIGECSLLKAGEYSELRKLSELLLAPRGIPNNGKKENDPAAEFFGA